MQLPETFIESLLNAPGFDKEAFETIHQSGEQVTSVRINAAKYRYVHKLSADVNNLFLNLLLLCPGAARVLPV